jgi:K+-transporting ATPase ATPase C chain
VVQARHLPLERLRQLVVEHEQGRLLDVLGEPRVNVLLLNLALDQLK